MNSGAGNEEYIVQCDMGPLGNDKTDRPNTYVHCGTAHTMYSMRGNWLQSIEVRFTVADVYRSPSIKEEGGEGWVDGSGVMLVWCTIGKGCKVYGLGMGTPVDGCLHG